MATEQKPSTGYNTGLVGFFDILGYQNFAANNDVQDGVQSVLEALEGMPRFAQELAKRYLPKNDESVETILEQTKALVFSDTVLLTCPIVPNAPHKQRHARWLIFILQSAILQRKMFHFGFPIRGAISYGGFIRKDSCFAGRAIIEAYQLASKVDAAATIFTDSAKSAMDAHYAETGTEQAVRFAGLCVEYLTPLKAEKGSESRRRWTVNFARMTSGELESLTGDARELVAASFWKHNKDLPESAYAKLLNTELLLRYLRKQS